MKKFYALGLFYLAFLVVSCSKTATTDSEQQSEEVNTSEIVESATEFTQEDQENVTRLIRLTLTDLFKEDIEKGFLDSLSRQFKYSQVDLNEDGNLEILVGLTGPYFCGSGGCTVLLLTSHGDVITRFSVVKYPAYLDQETSNGWKNLILYSGGENRVAQFDGITYPENPSTLTPFKGSIDNLPIVLDWENQESFTY